MNLQSIILNSVLACAVTVLGASTSWAVPVNITSDTSNPSWSQVHDGTTGGGTSIYKPLSGTLTGDLDYWDGGWRLSNIMGVLTDSDGSYQGSTVTILDGWLHDGGSEYAHGFFEYEIDGGPKDGYSGTFTFLNDQPANYLTETYLQLWGGDMTKGIAMEFRADITLEAAPEPSTILLFASGILIGVIWLRFRKAQA